MKIPRDPRIVGAWIAGLFPLIVYTITIAPTVAFWDTGEFIAAAFSLGITHPPGAPTFMLLGRLFCIPPTPFGVAAQVNFISVLTSAVTVLLLYGIILEIFNLWERDQEEWKGFSPLVKAVSAGTGALAYAFSHSAWFSAVEAEVYSLSMMVTALCLWLALRHLHGAGDTGRASLLLLIGYVLGVGTGNHLLALLTVPSILLLLWFFDREVLKRKELWVGAVVLFALGYTIYALIYIRSGLNPPVDMNNPENWQNFWQVLQRRQYGTESMLVTMFDRSADFWGYQLNYHFLRYLRAEFLMPFYVIALLGALVNFNRDRRTFLANAGLWLIMGLGLVVYLDMPDPQPRDRDYIFVGCYFATAVWIGIGMAGLAGFVQEYFERGEERSRHMGGGWKDLSTAVRTSVLITGALGVILVGTQLALNFHKHDRRGDYIAWDYGYNILQTCQPDAVIFTNGDNDTYPLWYLQVVEGIRRDVSVINLSILNLPWYIKELRDREPKVPISLSDRRIDTAGYAWFQQDSTFTIAGLSWRVPGNTPIRVQDQMVAHIIGTNSWRRPVYFAVTVPPENEAWFSRYLQREGFASRVNPAGGGINAEAVERNLREVFQFRGITDPRIYKDENASTLLHNYRVVFQEAARTMMYRGDFHRAYDLIEYGHEKVDFSAPDFRSFHAIVTQAAGDTAKAQRMLEEIIDREFELPGSMVMSHVTLMYSYAATGRFEDAIRIVNKWLQISPGDVEVRQWLEPLSRGEMPEGLRRLVGSLIPSG